MDPFINDGQAQGAYVAPVRGLYAECRFRHRPLPVEELDVYLAGVAKLSAAEVDRKAARLLTERIEGWDYDRPPSAENLLRLRPQLFARVLGIVLGTSASDDDP